YIFKAEYSPNTSTWNSVTNLGMPINTPEHDLFYVVAGDGEYAYFNSVQEGGYGGEDIYRIKLKDKQKEKRQKLKKEITGKQEVEEKIVVIVKDDQGEVLENVEVVLYNKGNREISNLFHTNENNHYVFTQEIKHLSDIKIHVVKEGYLPNTEIFTVKERAKEHEYTLTMDRVEKGARMSINAFHFQINSDKLLPESYIEIKKLVTFMKSHPDVVARLEGHTDNVGSAKYNEQLSKKRAEAVKHYMKGKGISSERMVVIGFGESQPIGDNNTKEGRYINRRLEFVIDSH
ncbi:MAG: OmpA family protein, partial [Cyclobacteriaceae bacterium]